MIHISRNSLLVALLASCVIAFPPPPVDDDDANPLSEGSTPAEVYDLAEELFAYEPEAGAQYYEDMERFFPTYWPARVAARDQLCTMCLAVISRQDVLAIDNLNILEALLSPDEAETFETIRVELEFTEVGLDMNLGEPVSVADGVDLCSDITQDVLVEDAARKRGSARRQLDEGPSDEVERTVRFYNRFIKKMQKVPRYLTCDSVDVPQISRLNDIFRRAIVAQQLDA